MMQGVNFAVAVTVTASLAGILFGVLGYWRGTRSDSKMDGENEGALKSNTEYIKRRIDDVLLEQKDTNKTLSTLTERVARVEESTKQAHKRLDGIERRINSDDD